jgi:hypothetical protein
VEPLRRAVPLDAVRPVGARGRRYEVVKTVFAKGSNFEQKPFA